MQFQEMAKFGQLAVQILVHRIEPLLQLLLRKFAHGVVLRVVVHVWKEDSLGEGRADVLARAAVTVSAGANLRR